MEYLPNAGSHNVFQGNNKLILGLVWTLIQKYQIKVRGMYDYNSAITHPCILRGNFKLLIMCGRNNVMNNVTC